MLKLDETTLPTVHHEPAVGVTYKKQIVEKLALLPDDMPLFLVLASDVLGPETVNDWCHRARRLTVSEAKIASAHATADAMEDWQIQNGKNIPG